MKTTYKNEIKKIQKKVYTDFILSIAESIIEREAYIKGFDTGNRTGICLGTLENDELYICLEAGAYVYNKRYEMQITKVDLLNIIKACGCAFPGTQTQTKYLQNVAKKTIRMSETASRKIFKKVNAKSMRTKKNY